MNVIIKNDNQYFNATMGLLLRQALPGECMNIKNIAIVDEHSFDNADIAILKLSPEDGFICDDKFKKLRDRRPRLFIGIVENKTRYTRLTRCMENMVIVQHNDAVETVERKMNIALKIREKAADDNEVDKCQNCRHYTLSSREKAIAQLIFNNQSINQISARLALSTKTVHSCKQKIKNKFNLQRNHELLNLLQNIDLD